MKLSEQLDDMQAKAVALEKIWAWMVEKGMTVGFLEGTQVDTIFIELFTELKILRAANSNGLAAKPKKVAKAKG